MARTDCMPECNEYGTPPVDFEAAFCSRCIQPDCTRSLHGKTKFDQRVGTWYERLFQKVPRMSTEDPRYPALAGVNFRDLPAPQTAPVQIAVPSSWGEPDPAPASPSPAPLRPRNAPMPARLLLANTPLPPATLPGAPAPAQAAPVKDPWTAPTPAAHDAAAGKVVRRGAVIKFGPGGVE